MNDAVSALRRLYDRFNARDIDAVLAGLAEDVMWANGMEGGHVHGHAALRAYWSGQWAVIDPHVEPIAFQPIGDDAVLVQVRQVVRDLAGRPLDAAGGADGRVVGHIFHFRDGKVARFDIEGAG